MIEQMNDRREFAKIKTLCDRCSKATGDRCLYLHLRDVEEGLQAAGAAAVAYETRYGRVYRIVWCPGFEEGELPPWRK